MTRVRAIVDQSELDRKLADVTRAAQSQPGAMRQAGEDLLTLVRGTFRDEVDPWGNAWHELSPATIANRLRGKGDDPLARFSVKKLVDKGDLYRSLHNEPASDGSGFEISEGEGLQDVRAVVHQFGDPDHKSWGHEGPELPARASLPLRTPEEPVFPDDWIQTVFAPIRQAIEEEINR